MKKKVVVIGGSGFIGSHVADQLTEEGFDVVIYDKQKSKWLKNDQSFVSGDILDNDKLNHTIADSSFVYNFAGMSDLNLSRNQPLNTIKFNILGNLNVMEACCLNKVERFIYASSVYVHSREGGFYRCSKQASEEYIEEFYKCYGLKYTIMRYGSL